jgi:hypothetical protein
MDSQIRESKEEETLRQGGKQTPLVLVAYRTQGQDRVTQNPVKDVMKALNGHKVNRLYQDLVVIRATSRMRKVFIDWRDNLCQVIRTNN